MADQKRVLVVVFDGLQSAQITPDLMPNLAEFARTGVTFANHHPVFPTVTRVNASSLVTGCRPGLHGLAGNTFLCRDYDPHQVIPAMEPTLQAIADATGRPLLSPTLADRLHAHGMEYVAIGTGTSGNAYVHNPNAASSGGATIHPQFTLPRHLHAELEDRFGEWPPEVLPNTARLNHGRRILTEYVLPEINPAVALLWLSEPDKTQHEDGVGLGRAPQALREADVEFGEVLSWLARNGRSECTDILIASDHGYSTITEAIPIESMMRESGFPTVEKPGGVAVAGNGGSALFYVHENNPDTAETVAQWLTSHEWCGPLFASERVGQPSGTLPASLIGCDGPRGSGFEHVVPVGQHSQRGRTRRACLRHRGTGRTGAAREHEPARIKKRGTGQRPITPQRYRRGNPDREHRFCAHHPASVGDERCANNDGRPGTWGSAGRKPGILTEAVGFDTRSAVGRLPPKSTDQPRWQDSLRRLGQSRIGSNGGGSGIRTHEGISPAGFQDRCIRPLCHPSATKRE